MQPHHYKHRILVAVSGLSPQILTETLFGLATTAKNPFIPTQIYLITTSTGANSAKLNLLDNNTGKFYAFCKDYQLNHIQFTPDNILTIKNASGQELDDIRTPEENEAAADFITNIIRSVTEDADTAVHVSIAGGRKTLGYYIGYALSLFGRDQDRLSHVLVSQGYEGHPEFYYPTPKTDIIQTRDTPPKPLDTSKAKVTLAEIPFIRMRQDIPRKLLNGKAGFLETVQLARKAELPPKLIINKSDKTIFASDESIKLSDSLFAFYCWLLEHTVNHQVALEKPLENGDPNKEYKDQYLQLYRSISGELRDIDATEKGLEKGMESKFFSEKVSRINKKLEDALGQRLADPYKIASTRNKKKGSMLYSTQLTIEQLKI